MTSVEAGGATDCGVSPVSNRIIGGEEAAPHSWPWQCSVQVAGTGHICGCSIVAPDWVITAAHCRSVQGDHLLGDPKPGHNKKSKLPS